MKIIVLLGFVIFCFYNGYALSEFGIPESLSNTYYLLEKKKKNLGWLFTGMMTVVAFLLLTPWIEITEKTNSNFTFLTFLAAAGILFVGAAPKFKETMEGTVHKVSAIIAAAGALLWDIIICTEDSFVIGIYVIFILLSAVSTGTLKSAKIYWLEMIAFYSTFTILIAQYFI